MHIIVDSAIAKQVKVGWLLIDELFGFFQTLFLLKVPELVFEVFLSNKF